MKRVNPASGRSKRGLRSNAGCRFRKSIVVSSEKYYRFMEKVLSFCPKSTIVLTEKYYRFSERYIPSSKKVRTFRIKRPYFSGKKYVPFSKKALSPLAKGGSGLGFSADDAGF